MEHKGIFLPHIQPFASRFFITFILFSEKIAEFYKAMKIEQEKQLSQFKQVKNSENFIKISKIRKKYFDIFDNYLGKNPVEGKNLTDKINAEIISRKLQQYNNQYYTLSAYCIMSNHVHILIDTSIQLKNISENEEINAKNFVNVSKIMQLIKGASSFEINKNLNLNGSLWLRDYWDHLVRNDKEFENIINYIAQNPVKAGLVDDWEKWDFTLINRNINFS